MRGWGRGPKQRMAWLSAAGCTGGGERDWVAKACVSPDGEAELYSGTIGRWGVRGKGEVNIFRKELGG